MKKNGIASTPMRQPEAVAAAVDAAGDVGETPDGNEAKAAVRVQTATVLVELPLGGVDSNEYLSSHVEARLKTLGQRMAMKRMLRGLQNSGAKTKDGRPVQRAGEAIRWLMEQIGNETAERLGGEE